MVLVPEVTTPVIPVGWIAVHEKVAPGVVLLKVTKAEVSPEQIVWLVGEKFTTGLGFTVMVNVSAILEHPLAVAITVMVDVTGVVPPLVGVNTGIFPLPEAASPILGLVLVHE